MNIDLTQCIGESFYDIHHEIKHKKYMNFLLGGGRGSLKSSTVFIELVYNMTKDAEADKIVHAVVLRKVHNTIRDSVFANIIWAINILGLNRHWKWTTSPMQFSYKGCTILFRSCAHAEDAQKIKSIKFEKGYCKYGVFEEVTEFDGMDEVDSIQQSIFRGGDDAICFMMYNPPPSRHNWVNKEAKIYKADTLAHMTTYLTAPKEWLGKAFIQKAEYMKEYNIKKYNHMYLGHEIGEGLEIYPTRHKNEGLLYVREISNEEIKGFHTIHRGIDFGFTKDASCYVECFYDETKDILYIFNEVYGHGMTNQTLVDMIKPHSKNTLIYADSAEPRTINELRLLGLSVVGAEKGADSKNHGIKWLQSLNMIIIDKRRCPYVTMDLETYEYEKNKYDEMILEYPKEPHGSAATRYALCKKIKYSQLIWGK